MQHKVWAMVLVVLVAAGAVLRLLTRPRLSITECFLVVLRPALLQGGLPSFAGTRQGLFIGLWFLYCFLINAFYSGVLYKHLTVVEEEKVVDSVEDLVERLEQGKIDVSLAKGSFLVEVLRTQREDPLGKIAAFEKESWFQFQRAEEVIDVVGKDPSWSIFTGLTSISALASTKGAWKYHFSRETYLSNSIGIVAKKNSPLIPAINNILKYIRSSGLISHWLRRIQTEQENHLERPAADSLFKLTLTHLAVGFVVLAVGFCLATLVFLAEMLHSSR